MNEKCTLFKVFASSFVQLVVFKIILIVYLTYIPWPQSWPLSFWCAIIADILIPFTCGCVCCLMVQSKNLGKGRRYHNPAFRLVVRLLGIACALIMGFALESIRSNNLEGVVNFLVEHNIYTRIFYDILFNFNGWFIAAFFPLVYAVVETILIVKHKS